MANDKYDEQPDRGEARLSDGRERLGSEFERPTAREDRELGEEFASRNTSEGRRLGEEFLDRTYGDERELGRAFNDPNSADDKRLGHDFEKTNSSAKKQHRPVGEVVSEPFKKPGSKKTLFLVLTGLLITFLLILILGWIPRAARKHETEDKARQETERPTIDVLTVHRSKSNAGFTIPGTTTPLIVSSVYARANGYLKKRYVDIGDHVHKGQLLAVIDAPDIDQQVEQARQQLQQAEAQLRQQITQLALTKVTVDRYRVLVAKGVFSRQDGDQREADYQAQVANVASSERNVEAFRANLQRQIALQSYERVTAPFDGIITQRNVEDGDLISAQGSSGGTPSISMGQGTSTSQSANAGTNSYGSSGAGASLATPSTGTGTQGGALFTISQSQRLRILVSVPEGYASSIHTGQQAVLHFQEFPETSFHGQVTRTAGSVDQNTRTMITELQIDNSAGRLLPGMYAVATFAGAQGQGPLMISGDAVAVRKDSTMVALINNDKVKLVPVSLGRDFGPEIEILGGLHEGDVVASTFTDDVQEGAQVRTHMSKDAEEQASQSPAGASSTPPGGSTQYGDPGIEDQDMQGQNAKPAQQKAKGASKSNGKQESKP